VAIEEGVKRARLKLALIGLFFALPFALAWIAYWFHWTPGRSGNYGALLQPPRQVPAGGFVALDGKPFSLASLRGKWVMLQFDAAGCDAYCERKLYFMRQLRVAQGKDRDRVERVWILTDGGVPRRALMSAIDGTYVVRAADVTFAAAFPPGERVQDHIYLIDPHGNLMMRFPRDPDPTKMLKDLQRLLKISQIG
jgi:cytochrome oxidase Cu insertion factor (SCO1/SenC/PrrC family)